MNFHFHLVKTASHYFVQLIFVVCIIIIGIPLNGQTVIKGSIRDAQSNTPIGFATIGIKNKSIGVVSNAEGDFQIPASYQKNRDTLIVSCIGYEQVELPLISLKPGQINIITLNNIDYALPEAMVESKRIKLSAVQMVRRAIKNIPENYPQHPFSYIGYYRDYQKKDDAYINLNEGILEIFDQGFQSEDQKSTQIKLYQFLLNRDFAIDSTTTIAYDNKVDKYVPNSTLTPFGGNELSILRMHDAIRNFGVHSFSFVDTFALDFINHHKFNLLEPTANGDQILHCIGFKSRISPAGEKFKAEGKIYIEQGSYAIHKLSYAMYEEQDMASQLMYEIQVEYSKVDGFMYLNYVSFNNLFYIAEPPPFKVEDIFFDTSKFSNTSLSSIIDQKESMAIKMNKAPERTSAMNKDNYIIKFGNRKLEIDAINVGSGFIVELYFNNLNLVEILNAPNGGLSNLSIEFGDIYDKDHHKLNEPLYIKVRQFREFFRQKITTSSSLSDGSPFIRKDTTLTANLGALPYFENLGEYWMNTPLKN